jgi:hypothetical protein
LHKSLTKRVTKYSPQNCDDRLKLAFFGHCDQMQYMGGVLKNLTRKRVKMTRLRVTSHACVSIFKYVFAKTSSFFQNTRPRVISRRTSVFFARSVIFKRSSVAYTRMSEIFKRSSVIFTRIVRFSHAKCDFDMHECHFHTHKGDLDTHECG